MGTPQPDIRSNRIKDKLKHVQDLRLRTFAQSFNKTIYNPFRLHINDMPCCNLLKISISKI